jgi:dsDNA-specific endonuclease/ATPase MutS2
MLAVASVMEKYSLSIPGIGTGGIGFVNARNLFLVREQLGSDSSASLQPVSYSIGRVSPPIRLAKPRNTVLLTGANSGGKTTLLNTLAAIHILALLGLPVPAERAEVTPMPIYLFRKRVARRIGSLEHVLRSTIPPLADRRRKLVLIDELEALTEPGAAGRIIAAIVNRAATTSSLFLLVTHLAKETLPYVKLPVRVDGIEASGLNERGELAVDRQPRFDHIGSSTPKLIVLKLSKTTKDRAVKAIYDDVLASLEEETGAPVQAPIALPWVNEDDGG